jgi:hypothetical protein
MAKTTTTAPDALTVIEVSRAVFGEHPDDVISPLNTASEALFWLEELFGVIHEEAEKDNSRTYRIKRLADLGKYLAGDMGNYVDGRHGEFKEAIQASQDVGAQ